MEMLVIVLPKLIKIAVACSSGAKKSFKIQEQGGCIFGGEVAVLEIVLSSKLSQNLYKNSFQQVFFPQPITHSTNHSQ
jgi:hypothetical protein